jgi:transposase-like protein
MGGDPAPWNAPALKLGSVERRRTNAQGTKGRFSEEQIINVLKEHQAGIPVVELCRKHGIRDATFYTWRTRNSPSSPRAVT